MTARAANLAALAALAALWAAGAAAQERVRLRAGEHAGYSRVVLDIRGVGAWEADRDGRRLTLRFPGRDMRFETGQVYPGRRVTRVLRAEGAAAPDGSTLSLALVCDCETEIFALGDTRLVVDVRDARGAEGRGDARRRVASAPDAAPAPPGRPLRRTPAPPDEPQIAELRELAAAARRAPPAAPVANGPETMDGPDEVGGPAERDRPPTADGEAGQADEARIDVGEARRHLLEQLTRAAEQGLLEFRPTETSEAAAPPEPAEIALDETTPENNVTGQSVDAEEAAPSPVATPPASGTVSATAGEDARAADADERSGETPRERSVSLVADLAAEPQIAARSVFDRDAEADRRARAAGAAEAAYCVSDDRLDVAAWATAAPMSEQIPALRAALLGEFDRVDGAAARDLARLYIHFGFGAEAEAALRALPPDDPRAGATEEAALLTDLARIVDGRTAAPEGPVARSEGCSGQVGLWRLAAGLESAPPDRATMEALLAEAPIHIRRTLTPRIVEALLDKGETGAAGRIHVLLARAPGEHGDAFRLAGARLTAAEGRVAAAEAGYRALIADNSILAGRALLLLAESVLARGAPPPPRLLGDLEAMAFLLRGTDLGRRLRVVEVRLRAGDGALLPTMARIAADMRADPAAAPELRAAAQDIWRGATAEEVGAPDFARAAILHLDLVGEGPEADPARLAAARELTGLGLPNLALDALAPPRARGAPEAGRLAAEAHLALRAPEAALAALAGDGSREAALLRARAHARAGAHATAYAALAETEGEAARALRADAAWAGGDWQAAARLSEDPDRQAMAAYMARQIAPIDAPSPFDVSLAELDAVEGTPRAAFLDASASPAAPSLAGARRALELAEGARAFLTEILTDG